MSFDRYLVTSDRAKREQSIDLTRKMMQVRARLQGLRNHKVGFGTTTMTDRQPLSIPDTFKLVRESLGALGEDPDLEVDNDFLIALDDEQEASRTEIGELEKKAIELKEAVEGLWQDVREYEYELVAVFMHRGKHFALVRNVNADSFFTW